MYVCITSLISLLNALVEFWVYWIMSSRRWRHLHIRILPKCMLITCRIFSSSWILHHWAWNLRVFQNCLNMWCCLLLMILMLCVDLTSVGVLTKSHYKHEKDDIVLHLYSCWFLLFFSVSLWSRVWICLVIVKNFMFRQRCYFVFL